MDTLLTIFNECIRDIRDIISIILLIGVILLIVANKFRTSRKKTSNNDDKFWH
jgi:hypothetical protein